MTVTFVAGANLGLGREPYAAWSRWGTPFFAELAIPSSAQGRRSQGGTQFLPVDVTDDASVTAAAADVPAHEVLLDVMINNAGVSGLSGDPVIIDVSSAKGSLSATHHPSRSRGISSPRDIPSISARQPSINWRKTCSTPQPLSSTTRWPALKPTRIFGTPQAWSEDAVPQVQPGVGPGPVRG